jgi:ABC-type spermidine/putrescine transport system permease subunit I
MPLCRLGHGSQRDLNNLTRSAALCAVLGQLGQLVGKFQSLALHGYSVDSREILRGSAVIIVLLYTYTVYFILSSLR